MLNAESLTSSKGTHLESVFLTTQKSSTLTSNAVPSTANMYTPPSLVSSTSVIPTSTGTFVNVHPQPQYAQYPTSDNRSYNRNRSYDNSGRRNGSGWNSSGCQICGKPNHTAYYCHHRQNFSLPPPQFSQGSTQQHNRGQWRPHQVYNAQGNPGFVSPSPQANVVTSTSLGFSGSSPEMGYGSQSGVPGVGVQVFHPNSDISVFSSSGVPQFNVQSSLSAPNAYVPQSAPNASGSLLGSYTQPHFQIPQAYQQKAGWCKNLLQEYAQKKNYAIPLYSCQIDESQSGGTLISCTVDVGGMKYIGAPAKTKKEAEIELLPITTLFLLSPLTSMAVVWVWFS
ncbi:hypothetical protein Vadar_017541 [Vaccinium darrowii]|uniref:Uncharacterized protein n=1 Tax=Vaccinium darrowii TaxID=229202 RepID=A0ACB7YYF2_9ERIC|nr:hypothetical protein Vadar_017541 [Vaccinium darrowii]